MKLTTLRALGLVIPLFILRAAAADAEELCSSCFDPCDCLVQSDNSSMMDTGNIINTVGASSFDCAVGSTFSCGCDEDICAGTSLGREWHQGSDCEEFFDLGFGQSGNFSAAANT
jgi:hypothetical protein